MLTSICGSQLAAANGILIQARSLDGSRAAGCRPCSAAPLDVLPEILPSRVLDVRSLRLSTRPQPGALPDVLSRPSRRSHGLLQAYSTV